MMLPSNKFRPLAYSPVDSYTRTFWRCVYLFFALVEFPFQELYFYVSITYRHILLARQLRALAQREIHLRELSAKALRLEEACNKLKQSH